MSFYDNTNMDRKAYRKFKMLCYIPLYGLIGFYYPIFMKDFCLIKPMQFDEAKDWTRFGNRVHLMQGLYIMATAIYLYHLIF